MNVRQIEIFWSIMRTGSITGAAQLLGISQPAVSKTLRYTEDQIGMTLFHRRSGRLYPVPEAQELFQIADTIFEDVERLRRATSDFRNSVSGRLNIVTIPTIAECVLVSPIGAFLRDHPQITFSLKLLNTMQVIDRVAHSQADIGLVYGPIGDSSVRVEELSMVNFVCAIHKDNPLAALPEIVMDHLAGERIISFHRASPWGQVIESAVAATSHSFKIGIECNHAVAALALVEQGSGVALVMNHALLRHKFPDVVFRPIIPSISLKVKLLVRHTPPLRRLTATMLNYFKSEVPPPAASESP